MMLPLEAVKERGRERWGWWERNIFNCFHWFGHRCTCNQENDENDLPDDLLFRILGNLGLLLKIACLPNGENPSISRF